jgi:hypothetical protein
MPPTTVGELFATLGPPPLYLPAAVAALALDSGCGQDCARAIEACRTYLAALDPHPGITGLTLQGLAHCLGTYYFG